MQTRMQSLRQFINRKAPLLVPVALLGVGAAHAQSTGGSGGSAAFTSAIAQASADIGTYGAALVGVAAVGVAFMIAIKYVKKIRGAA